MGLQQGPLRYWKREFSISPFTNRFKEALALLPLSPGKVTMTCSQVKWFLELSVPLVCCNDSVHLQTTYPLTSVSSQMCIGNKKKSLRLRLYHFAASAPIILIVEQAYKGLYAQLCLSAMWYRLNVASDQCQNSRECSRHQWQESSSYFSPNTTIRRGKMGDTWSPWCLISTASAS